VKKLSYKASEDSGIMAVSLKTRVTISNLPAQVTDPDDFPVTYNAKLEYFEGGSWYALVGKNLHQYDDATELTSSPEVTDASGDVTLTIASGELTLGDHTIRVKYLGD